MFAPARSHADTKSCIFWRPCPVASKYAYELKSLCFGSIHGAELQNGDCQTDAKLIDLMDDRNRKDANFLWQNVCNLTQPSRCMCAFRSTAALIFLWIAERSCTVLVFDASIIPSNLALLGNVHFANPVLSLTKTFAIPFISPFLVTRQSHQSIHHIDATMCVSGREF